MMYLSSEQPLAIITGAARRLGRIIALGLAKEGFTIGLHYHQSVAEAQRVAGEIESMGGRAILYPADLTNPAEITQLFDRVSSSGLPLKVLVNSAAEMRSGRLGDDSPEDWDATIALNLKAPWLCAREAYKLMRENGGVIINISDSGANRLWTGYPAYILSKSALETLTRLQAKEYAPSVRVNAVAPGLILPSENLSPQTWNRLVERLPLRHAHPEEAIVQAVVFLLRNEYITGEVVAVDGGYQLV